MTDSYDVVCIGGAITGSSVAYFLTENSDFNGTVAVIEPDPSYEFAQSSRAANSIREQYSQPININISQYGLDFIDNFHENVQVDGQSPILAYRGTGYLFLAASDDDLAFLESQVAAQHAEGAMTRMLTPSQVPTSSRTWMSARSQALAWAACAKAHSMAGHSSAGFVSGPSTMVQIS